MSTRHVILKGLKNPLSVAKSEVGQEKRKRLKLPLPLGEGAFHCYLFLLHSAKINIVGVNPQPTFCRVSYVRSTLG